MKNKSRKVIASSPVIVLTPSNLKPGQRKVVVYSKDNITVVVPDDAWDMKGDLSKLPPDLAGKLEKYSKNGFTKHDEVISSKSSSSMIPSGRKTLSDIRPKGYWIGIGSVKQSKEYTKRSVIE